MESRHTMLQRMEHPVKLNRNASISRLGERFDIVIVGGGATGLGIAVDSALRGHRTLLIEQSDFAKATSSRSTKLVHGGVRYLKQGNVTLVLEALRERERLSRNAPHLVRHIPFVIPAYHWWEAPFYGVGLKVYDAMAGRLGIHPSRHLSIKETCQTIPTIERSGLQGGIEYHDGQFDDARLAIHLAMTATRAGATLLNYVRCVGLIKKNGICSGLRVQDQETGEEHEISARVVVNATGAFADALRRRDDPKAERALAASQGVHLVLPRSFLPGKSAIMIPHTSDSRVLFAVPWHDVVILGTTDTPVSRASMAPRPLPAELEFLLTTAARYLTRDPKPSDVLSVFAGIRPLLRGKSGAKTSTLSRDHAILISDSGMLTVTGGKWTTYRKMAEDAVDQAEAVGGLDPRLCLTRDHLIHGAKEPGKMPWHRRVYGSDASQVEALENSAPSLSQRIHKRFPFTFGEVAWHVEAEMARTVEDVLARRTRLLILDARAAIEAAGAVADFLAARLGRSDDWARMQAKSFRTLAREYLCA